MASVTQSIRQPDTALAPGEWLRKNLFNTRYNSILTLVIGWFLVRGLWSASLWIATRADWSPITVNLILYLVGQYPAEQLWRVGLILLMVSFLFGLSWRIWGGTMRTFALALMVVYAVLALLPVDLAYLRVGARLFFAGGVAVLLGGYGLGLLRFIRPRRLVLAWLLSTVPVFVLLNGSRGMALPQISTTLWGGLLLNLLLAVVGITASFPLGVLLALGRRSNLPVVRLFCTLFIELIRGVPLISILFMASIILPLFLPEEVRIDRVARALIGITLFSAAYMAENVRGGLQAIPEGQYEAAKAIGLNALQTTVLIVLPQALRMVIPAIVGQFIALFKDTSLVVIVGLTDILGIGKAVILGNPKWVGAQTEVYLFVAAVFWVFTYAMSYGSRRLETALGVGER